MQVLLDSKNAFKEATGVEWTPNINISTISLAKGQNKTENKTELKPVEKKKSAKGKHVRNLQEMYT